ncbi:T9SS sorting signal type C domain-containing protein [Psychroserpens sp.]|uniref:T9SS sorting signal type C domain-containing protein n=1 Tax=Psychroserpens sp. TaxID=2020870 RepID=UPI00385F97F4
MIRKLLFFVVLTFVSQTALSQASGNDCATATPITLQYGTTLSTGFHEITNPPAYFNTYTGTNCTAGTTFYGGGRDGVYSITVDVTGDYTFDFANNGTTWKSLAVHSACPITLGNCLGSAGTAGNRDLPTTLTLTLTAGNTYYIVIDSWPPAAQYPPTPGSGVLNPAYELLITAPLSNDECINAIELFSDVDCSINTYTNDIATASAGAPAPSCANYQGGDVWFSYEVNFTGEFTITTEAGVMTDSGMAVYSGTCGSLTQIDCDDDFGTGAMSTITVTGRTPGEIVYIRLWEWGNNNNGTFGICVTTPIPPGDTGVFDDCANQRSQSLTSDFVCPPGTNTSDTVFGNLDGQPTADRQFSSANSTVCNTNTGAARRYEAINFTVPTTGLYVFDMTAAAGFDGMGYIIVNDGLYTIGSCATGTFVIGDDDSSAFGLNSRLTVNLTMGTPYTLVTTEFGGGGTGNSPYTWTVTTGPDVNWETILPIEWYTVAVGGTPIETGPGFNPVNYPGSGLTDTSVPGIYSYWYACPTAPASRTRVDYVIGKHWSGATSSDWNTASNWHGNSVPTDSQCLYIPSGTPNDPVIGDEIDGDGLNLTIRTGATLTLAANANANNFGSSLTIQDNIDIQGTGSLIVQDDANLIQVNDTPPAPNSGDITLNRNADIRLLDYVYWSSPVQNFDVSDVYGANTPTNRIYQWTPTTATGYLSMPGNVPIIVGDWDLTTSGNMSLGKGYAVRGPNGHTAGVSTATASFDGVANNGVITQGISSGNYSGGGLLYNPYGADNLAVTPLDDNWNLIGNPYPSAIDADTFLMLPSNNIIEGSVHIWTHGTAIGTGNGDSFYDDYTFTYSDSDYITYNISGSSYPNETFGGEIASGQGFFVLALNDNETGNVTFNNSMRSRTYSNTAFYRNAENDENVTSTNNLERHRIWLNIADQNGSASNTMVGYIEGATQQKDRLYDAFSREVNSLNIYSKINDERMVIQGRSLPFDEYDQVPLGTVIPQAGEYTIAISKVDGLFLDDNQNIYLEDTQTGTIHNLRATPYTFTETEATDYEERFILRYTNEALSIDDVEFTNVNIIAPKGDYIKVNSERTPIESIVIYDLLGRALISKNAVDKTEFIINNHNLSNGAYIVEVTLTSGQTKTQKVILKD